MGLSNLDPDLLEIYRCWHEKLAEWPDGKPPHASQHGMARAATGWRFMTEEKTEAAKVRQLEEVAREVERADLSQIYAQAETLELNENGTHAR